jgi:PAS domain S-box-containing protein
MFELENQRTSCSRIAEAHLHGEQLDHGRNSEDNVEAIRLWEQRCRILVRSARDIMFVLASDGVFVLLNAAFEHITGWSTEKWLGQPFANLVHGDDLSLVRDLVEKAVRGEATNLCEARVLKKSGGHVTLEFLITADQADGKAISILGIARDVTSQKQTEELLRQTQGQLRQDQKLEALARLTDAVAHDLNNVLTVIMGFGELLQKQLHPDNPKSREAAQIVKAGERGCQLTSQLLALSRAKTT